MKILTSTTALILYLWVISVALITLPSKGYALTISGDQVENTAENGNIKINNTVAGSTGKPLIHGLVSDGTLASPSPTTAGRALLIVGGGGYDGSSWTQASSAIDFMSSELWSASGQGSHIIFQTTPNGSIIAAGRRERMRITNDGKVGIGTGTPTQALDVVGSVNASGNITTTAGTITAASFSGNGASLTNIGSSALAAGAVTSSNIAYYSDVAIVALNGGDYTNPYDAMNDITTWCNNPSGPDSTHPCLLKIMPGLYDIGTNSVAMQPYCDIEGSGQRVTVIKGNVDSLTNGVVNGVPEAELRFLEVRNTGDAGGNTNTNAVAILNSFTPATPRLSLLKVTGNARGASGYNIGISNIGGADPLLTLIRAIAAGGVNAIGVHNENATPRMEHVYTTARNGTNNYGVYNLDASPQIVDTIAEGSGGSASYGVWTNTASGLSSVTIRSCEITGATNSVFTDNTGGGGSITYIGSTQLNAATATGAGGGSNKCAGVYDTSFTFYASFCP